jgi:hypothetical protein
MGNDLNQNYGCLQGIRHHGELYFIIMDNVYNLLSTEI